jgi:hypothetical protein
MKYSTPKPIRKSNISRINELSQNSSLAIERNLSNNWVDIIEELEVQSKDLEELVFELKIYLFYKIFYYNHLIKIFAFRV